MAMPTARNVSRKPHPRVLRQGGFSSIGLERRTRLLRLSLIWRRSQIEACEIGVKMWLVAECFH